MVDLCEILFLLGLALTLIEIARSFEGFGDWLASREDNQ